MKKQEKQAAKDKVKNVLQSLSDPINTNSDNENNLIPLNLLVPYENHPFKLYEGDRLSDMIRSIKEMGVLLPIIVRPIDDINKYQILSGHNRVNAAKEAGLFEIPAVIKYELSDDEAQLIVTETNLVQRSFADLLHSERAVALKYHVDAISKQGKRNDLINEINELLNADKIRENETSSLLETKLRSDEKIGNKYGLSRASVARYIRLTYLDKSLQDRVDNGAIGLYPAVSLSYLLPDEQIEVNQLLDENKYKINIKKAETLKKLSESKKLTNDKIAQILSGELNKEYKTKAPTSFTIKRKIYTKYFDKTMNPAEVESIIDKALEEYFNKHSK